ncbi:CBS domain-containing protein [Dactylosporangium sp. NPDC048998]|uniref:CBS domain-containing protein n=1 Tax=Dactylosporangium sp. NPDC048998 TaxID=3363976 RepID=UPI00371EBAA5
MAFEKVKESAKRGLATGRARVDETRAQRQRSKLLQELGEATYAEHTGQATHEAVAGKARALADFEQALREKAAARPERRRAKDIMHRGAECVDENESVVTAAQKMRELGVGSLPICGTDDRLHGILTDRDIVIRCIAEGQEPGQVRVRDLAQGPLAWVDAGAELSEVLRQMEERQVKRLPVIENHRLVGMISEHDLARNLDEHRLAEFVEKVYATS